MDGLNTAFYGNFVFTIHISLYSIVLYLLPKSLHLTCQISCATEQSRLMFPCLLFIVCMKTRWSTLDNSFSVG